MSNPPSLTSQVSINSGQNVLESQQKGESVVISADPINFVSVHRAGSCASLPLLSSIRKDEPIVTRRELWSYYRQSSFFFPSYCLTSWFLKYTTTEIMYVNLSCFPRTCSQSFQMKGVGPNGYTMTLFQSLANAAGYDPVSGPGSSCNASNASGQCVLPWAGGTKAVSSVVLIANGLSFAVSFHWHFNSISVVDHHVSLQGPDCSIHDSRLSRWLWIIRSLVIARNYMHQLGSYVRMPESD